MDLIVMEIWTNLTNIWNFQSKPERWMFATNSEVKERLLTYAKNKYPIGTIFNSTQNSKDCKICGNYTILNGYCVYDNNGTYELFDSNNGIWAEIISQPKEKVETKMKKYVKCETQEQWDYAVKKLGRKSSVPYKRCGDCINLNFPSNSQFKGLNEAYTFQEWLDLNNYTFEEEFKVGDYVYLDKIDLKSFGKILDFSLNGKCVIVDPIINNHNGNTWAKSRLTKATQQEINDELFNGKQSEYWSREQTSLIEEEDDFAFIKPTQNQFGTIRKQYEIPIPKESTPIPIKKRVKVRGMLAKVK